MESNKQKIVIVEDNQALADIYGIRLEMIGYEIHKAYNGEEGLKVIEEVKPDLVLLDMMLPKVAGDEVLKRMRNSDWGKDTRVFIISNLNEEDAPAGLRDLNIEGYAVKANLQNDDIDSLVDKILTPEGQEEISLENNPNDPA